jgi:hypothetical protein
MAGVAGCGRGFAAGGRIAAVGGSRRAGFAEGLAGVSRRAVRGEQIDRAGGCLTGAVYTKVLIVSTDMA